MQRESEDETWRAIVENYGDRAELIEEATPAVEEPILPDPVIDNPIPAEPREPLPVAPAPDEDRFIPPPTPAMPRVPPDRLAAWSGLFGSPTILLIALVLGIDLPSWLGYLLIAGFVGGFGYLVLTMPRSEDIDPWDDGARL